jgi:SAM-dependent methyltransferase
VSDAPTPREAWEQRYGVEHYLFGTEPNDFLRDSVAQLPRGAALCLAEGEGRNAVFLAEQGYAVHSVDLTAAGVAKTRKLAHDRGVTVHAETGDLATYDLGTARWDLIVSIFAHIDPEARRHLHRRVTAALKPGGVFLLEAYRPEQVGRGTGGPPTTATTMTLDALTDELAGLELVHAAELDRPVIEGPGHTGVGAVVQVIARRR